MHFNSVKMKGMYSFLITLEEGDNVANWEIPIKNKQVHKIKTTTGSLITFE